MAAMRGSCENPIGIGLWMNGSKTTNRDTEEDDRFRPGNGSVFVIDISEP